MIRHNRSTHESLIWKKKPVPMPATRDMEYATHDFRPAAQDPRTDDHIRRIKADAVGDLLIAMPSATAVNTGWVRVTAGTKPDYCLDRATRSGVQTPGGGSALWRSVDKGAHWTLVHNGNLFTFHRIKNFRQQFSATP